MPPAAIAIPSNAPDTHRMKLSVSNCRMIRLRVAPNAVRTEISRWRPTARESSRLATLAQAISAKQDQHGGTNASHYQLMHLHYECCPARILVWICHCESRGNSFHLVIGPL